MDTFLYPLADKNDATIYSIQAKGLQDAMDRIMSNYMEEYDDIVDTSWEAVRDSLLKNYSLVIGEPVDVYIFAH